MAASRITLHSLTNQRSEWTHTAVPFSLQWSHEKNVALSLDRADARVGQPLSAGSVAGVHRRACPKGISPRILVMRSHRHLNNAAPTIIPSILSFFMIGLHDDIAPRIQAPRGADVHTAKANADLTPSVLPSCPRKRTSDLRDNEYTPL